jgi:hypothetical protein
MKASRHKCFLKQKRVDPEQEAVLRRLFAKSILEKFIGMPNTPEVREEIKNEVLKAIQVKDAYPYY